MSVYRNKFLVVAYGALTCLALDQITKFWVLRHFPFERSVAVVEGTFHITHKLNPGAAFGLFRGQPLPFFLVVSVIALGFIVYFVSRVAPDRLRLTVALSMILGGALGNISDRLRIGAVVDFLDLRFGSRIWPTFNVADIVIVVGVLLFLWDMSRHEMQWDSRRHDQPPNDDAILPPPDLREETP
ncbi:MAG: signal peptidase II [Deltaproteobacteria bacterium]|nr:signal peptidase II [Deltaproteobacteria bacterium]